MMMGNHRTSRTFTLQQICTGLFHTPKQTPTFMPAALPSLVDNVLCGFSS